MPRHSLRRFGLLTMVALFGLLMFSWTAVEVRVVPTVLDYGMPTERRFRSLADDDQDQNSAVSPVPEPLTTLERLQQLIAANKQQLSAAQQLNAPDSTKPREAVQPKPEANSTNTQSSTSNKQNPKPDTETNDQKKNPRPVQLKAEERTEQQKRNQSKNVPISDLHPLDMPKDQPKTPEANRTDPVPKPLLAQAAQSQPRKSDAPAAAPPAASTERSPEMRAFEARLNLQPFHMVLNNFRMDYRMTPPNVTGLCVGQQAFVIVMSVGNSRRAAEQRAAIRDMLGRQGNVSLVHRFIMSYQSDLRTDEVWSEMQRYGDIIYTDAEDTYYNNFIKWYAMYEWHQAYCTEADYFVKTDDDTVLSLERFFHWAALDFDNRTQGVQDYVLCQGVFNNGPIRDKKSKWYVPRSEFRSRRYPDWCTGFFVAIPSRTVQRLFNASHQANRLHIDDVLFTGVARVLADVPLIDFPGIRERGIIRPACSADGDPMVIATHFNKSPFQVRRVFHRLQRVKCKKPAKPAN